jgi:hypothetical protein
LGDKIKKYEISREYMEDRSGAHRTMMGRLEGRKLLKDADRRIILKWICWGWHGLD